MFYAVTGATIILGVLVTFLLKSIFNEIKTIMDINALASSTKTVLELKDPVTSEPLGVFIHGFTPDSVEWRQAQREVNGPKKKTSVFLEKGGGGRIDVDVEDADKRRLLGALVVSDITGLENWEFNVENTKELFVTPKYAWIADDWLEHLDSRKNFFRA